MKRRITALLCALVFLLSLPDEDITVLTFILNTKSKKFHLITCRYVSTIAAENYAESGDTRDDLIADGYTPCDTCDP